MKKSEITNELKTFLKQEGCFDEYMQCFDEDYVLGTSPSENNLIQYAFGWYKAVSDDDFWDAVDDKWKAYLKTERTLNKPTIEEGKLSDWDESRIDAIGQNGNTGVKYDNDKPRYSLIPQDALHEVVKVLTYGAKKYSDDNWKKVENLQQRYKDAGSRHEYQSESNDFDDESSLYHLAHKICCDMFRLQDKIDKVEALRGDIK